MLTSWQGATCCTVPAVWSCEEKSCDWRTHTSLPLTVFIGWFDRRTSGGLRADTTSYTNKPSLQDCTKTPPPTLKRVVKQLTPFGATRRLRHDTSPLAMYRECVQAVHSALPVTVSQPEKVYIDRGTYTQTLLILLLAAPCIVCAGMSSVIDRRACCWWSDPTVKSLCGLIVCLCADVTHRGGTVEKRWGGRIGGGVRKSLCLWSGRGLYVSRWRGCIAVLGLHHKDYCNTVQMGPSCNRLGRVDWTTGDGWWWWWWGFVLL